MTLLSLNGVCAAYGRVEALRGIDLDVGEAEIVTLIGANGAGKSTTLMTICGNPRVTQGKILFDGAEISAMPTFEIIRLGIAQAPEGRRIFPRMTVIENLQIGATPARSNISRRTYNISSSCFPFSTTVSRNAAAPCRAASSRCWRSPARL